MWKKPTPRRKPACFRRLLWTMAGTHPRGRQGWLREDRCLWTRGTGWATCRGWPGWKRCAETTEASWSTGPCGRGEFTQSTDGPSWIWSSYSDSRRVLKANRKIFKHWQWRLFEPNLLFRGQVVAGVSVSDQGQRGGASKLPHAPVGFERYQHGDPWRRHHPGTDPQRQFFETVNTPPKHSITLVCPVCFHF